MPAVTKAIAPRWSDKELEILRQVYPTHGARVVSQITRRPWQTTMKRANRLGLKRIGFNRNSNGPNRPWSPEEERAVAERYLKDGALVLAQELGRTAMAISGKACRLGVASRSSGRRLMPIGTTRDYATGGWRRSKIAQIRVAMTGDRAKDWKRLEVHEWELQHGPVPAGFVLIVPRGMERNASNCKLRRIEDVPLLAANASASQEVIELNRLKAMLGYRLSRIEKANGMESARRPKRDWPPAEIAFLRASYGQQRLSEIGIALGRSVKSIARMVERLGLAKTSFGAWTQAEEALLISRFHTTRLADIAALLSRTPKAVEHHAAKLGLRKRVPA